ncbi:hypothetical protein [Pseudonocardia nigra]|uniref:hypothetical protein n=1 Tax=Pseudonocardia nigra TaxID=1921578 RepID=UPI001C5EE561|nr:hypothetical protein [Pseudonocardia nigra]
MAAYERALGVRIEASATDLGDDGPLLAAAADLVTAIGLRHGGLASIGVARAQWDWARSVLDRGSKDRAAVATVGAAARLADRLGWCLGEIGQIARAKAAYRDALALTEHDPGLRTMVMIDSASLEVDRGDARIAVDMLAALPAGNPALEFSACGVLARAHAKIGEVSACLAHVERADAAWSEVDLRDLPLWIRPYASGHRGHADHAAGKALFELTRRGHGELADRAAERLHAAAGAFGPERARAVERCRVRLLSLARRL